MIPEPREIYVDDGLEGLMSIEIVDTEGTKQIIKLRDPLMLPAPANQFGTMTGNERASRL